MQRKRIEIRGTVQGVGFRPFVYNLAARLAVCGFVQNNGVGVVIEAQAPSLDAFLHDLRSELPPLASITEWQLSDLPVTADTGFHIRDSQAAPGESALVPPDIATCADCLRDFTDPNNRRYGYEFTNCTNCGPRYTIIRDVPYDRPLTTMAGFSMCAQCEREYHDPTDRRFHAQPNACPVCGPQLSATIQQAREWLREGEIVAIKGLGGYHLACDATSGVAVHRLRDRKRRSGKPFAIMVGDLASAEHFAVLDDPSRDWLSSLQRPIVLLDKRPNRALAPEVAPGNRVVGLMLPSTPLHHRLFEDGGFRALVMTSGNLSEEPIVSYDEDLPRLKSLATRVLSHNRAVHTRVDDSVGRLFRGRPVLLRRSRGYVPNAIRLAASVPSILACGGQLKNTFCLTRGQDAILSQHIGDLENRETLDFFEETLAKMKAFFRIEPVAVAYDLHPGYLSTRYAQSLGLPSIGVQHHHAHVASCMAEHHLDGTVAGIALDGTGYGTDGQIWGGEVLTATYRDFARPFHFRYVPMPGGDAAIHEPWRMALGYLVDAFGADLPALPALKQIPEASRRLVLQLIRQRVQTVETSSCGRLFDAVAAITGLCLYATYEAQAAIELESAAIGPPAEPYPFEISGGEIDFRQAIRAIAEAVLSGMPVAGISARFHQTVASAVIEAARQVGLPRVCLSGGSFQNLRLLEAVVEGLEASGLTVYWQSEIPMNDGGLSLGQAIVASSRQ